MEVEFIFDSALKGLKESVGNFVTSFDHANYQRILKRVDAEEKKESDPRAKVHTKNVKNYIVHLEDASILDSTEYMFQLASSHALTTCKNLSRERGSVADPAWMAIEAQKIAASDKNGFIKEVKVLKGNELVANGMNLFWNVGKGAACEP
jgi:leucyl aminopeptidase